MSFYIVITYRNINAIRFTNHAYYNTEKGTSKECQKQQNCKWCRLVLIEPVHGW